MRRPEALNPNWHRSLLQSTHRSRCARGPDLGGQTWLAPLMPKPSPSGRRLSQRPRHLHVGPRIASGKLGSTYCVPLAGGCCGGNHWLPGPAQTTHTWILPLVCCSSLEAPEQGDPHRRHEMARRKQPGEPVRRWQEGVCGLSLPLPWPLQLGQHG